MEIGRWGGGMKAKEVGQPFQTADTVAAQDQILNSLSTNCQEMDEISL